MPTPNTATRPAVVALAYDGLCTFEFGIAVEVFGLPRPEFAGLVLERVSRARELLEADRVSMERVAERCGFGAAAALGHHFRSRPGTTPTAYRARFRRTDPHVPRQPA